MDWFPCFKSLRWNPTLVHLSVLPMLYIGQRMCELYCSNVSCLSVIYLNEQVTTLHGAGSLADEFALTHKAAFAKREPMA